MNYIKDEKILIINNKIIALVFCSLISASSIAQVSLSQKAKKAGAYWSAIIMASEFRRTNCGSSINIASQWTDADKAKIEIKSRFPANDQIELDQALSKKNEADYRKEFNEMWSKVPIDKCIGARNLFWNMFDSAVTDWNAIK